MPARSAPPHLFFLTQPKGNGAILFSMRGTPRGPELSKIGTFDNRDDPQLLSAMLNAALQGEAGAFAKVHRRSASLTGPLRKAIVDVAEEIEDAHRDAARARAVRKLSRAVAENLEQPNVAMFSLFSTTACGSCSDCGCAADEDCSECPVCGFDSRGCENCGIVEMTPRAAYVLHRELRDLADRTYLAAHDSDFWEHSVPVSAENQSNWFLLHCAHAYDDLAADLLAGGIPVPRCLAESVLLGYAVPSIGGRRAESVCGEEAYQALPASRFDRDWDFLVYGSGVLYAGERAYDFLEADAVEEDLWDEWFKPYPDVKPRDRARGLHG